MGLMGQLGRIFGPAPDPGAMISLQGKMTRVSPAELAGLNKLAEAGMIQKDPSDASIGTGNFTQGVPAFWFARAVETGGRAESLSSPYAKSVWVQRAIKTIAGPVASVRLTFLEASQGEESGLRKSEIRNPKSEKRHGRKKRIWTSTGVCKRIGGDQGEAKEIDLPAVRTWLERPMRGLNWSDFVEASIGWMKMQECFWLLSDETLKPFPEVATKYPPVIVARPNWMRAVIEDGALIGWVFTQPGGKVWKLLPEQVIQLRYWNPDDQWRGLGEYESAHLAAEADYLAGRFARNLMANNGDLGGIIVAKSGMPSDAQREQIIMDLRAKRAAQLRGELRYAFLTGDIEVTDPKITSVDAPFISQRLENRHEVAAAFGVPMSIFDVKAAYSIGSASDFFQLITTTCIPTGAKFCDALERLIERVTGERVEVGLEWDEHPVMQAVRRERIDTVDKLWSKGMPMSAINDYLALEMEEFEGWDVGFLPISVTPVEFATEPPPEPSQDAALSEPTTEGNEGNEGPEEVQEMVKALRGGIAKSQSPITKGRAKRVAMWERHMRQRSGVVRAYQSKVSKVLNDFRVIALRKLEQHGAAAKSLESQGSSLKSFGSCKSLLDFIFDAQAFGKHLVLAINPVSEMAVGEATAQVLSEVGRPNDPWKMSPPRVKELIRSREQDVMGCGQTVRDQLNTALEEGYANGESTADLAGRVRGVFNGLSKGEARRIATTETAVVFNKARREAGVAAGVQYHAWLSSHGPNVRPAHQDAEDRYADNPIPIGEPFDVDGEKLMHPGDPSGSAGNIINCQCIEIMSAGPGEEE